MIICKTNLCLLLDNSLAYVMEEKAEDLFPYFSKAIEDNKDNYDKFLKELTLRIF